MSGTATPKDEKQHQALGTELGRFRGAWSDEEAATRSDVRRLPDDEERLRWTTKTLAELEGDGGRLDYEDSRG